MCGIVGYIGHRQAQPIILNSLSRLEYRGYDSCGVAVRGSGIKVCKNAIRVEEMRQSAPVLEGTTGIGHNRWATHGRPSAINAHPHLDCQRRIAVVHNGVLTNFRTLKQQLIDEGHVFVSETDTEVIPHLIEKYYQGNLEEAVRAALAEVHGSYAIVAITENEPKLVVARQDSPLVIGLGDGEIIVASDVTAILDCTNRVIYLENGDIGTLTRDGIRIMNAGKEVKRNEERVLWSREDIQKAGYEHFMAKEIHEQPRVLRDTLVECCRPELGTRIDESIHNILILACGTSYHAGLVGRQVIEELLGISVNIEVASEFNHRHRLIPPDLAIVITQSGETADVLLSIKKLNAMGVRVLVITNVPGSTASRVGERVLYTRAGPEVSVSATKSYSGQLMALYHLALSCPAISSQNNEALLAELRQLSGKVQELLQTSAEIVNICKSLATYENVLFIGRGLNFPVALEGALKMKEISYIHAEGYAAGELKHGPFALLSQNVPVVAVTPLDDTYESMMTSIKEVKSRLSPVIAVADETDDSVAGVVDQVIKVPHVSALFTPILNSIALQLLAYHTARLRGCPIDFPRNLAKSVTVE